LVSAEPWLKVFRETVELPSGRILDDFYRIVLRHFAVIVAMTPSLDLVMVHTYRHGLGRVSLAVPAGFIEPGETPLEAAKRELLEETGYASHEWETLGNFVVDGNRGCGTGHFFVARDATQVAVTKPDDTEELEVELVSPRRFLEAVRTGDIALLATVSAVTLALLNAENRQYLNTPAC
jgi:ADP-ribose pyrophosphatase